MSTYYVWQEGQAVIGPYEASDVRGWIAEGRLAQGTKYSTDGVSWMGAAGTKELVADAATSESAPPQPAEDETPQFIRQGMNVQGPYAMSRIRGYVVQRRIQPYMLFSPDRVWWCGPEHIPGLLPEGYVAVPPPARPTAVPTWTGAAPSAPPAPADAAGGAPGPEVGSITLTGYRLDEADMAPPSASSAPSAPLVLPPTSRIPGTRRGAAAQEPEEIEPAPSVWRRLRKRR